MSIQMESYTGNHLFSPAGEDIGEIVDVVGVHGPDFEPAWLAVKTGWFAQRLVPYTVVRSDDRHDRFVTVCAANTVKHAPRVPVHLDPIGEDLDHLCRHYGIRPAEI